MWCVALLAVACGGAVERGDLGSGGAGGNGAAGGFADGGAGGETAEGGSGGQGGETRVCAAFPDECHSDEDCGGAECGVCGDWPGNGGPMTCVACPGPAECDQV
jgi:hypothetical protein